MQHFLFSLTIEMENNEIPPGYVDAWTEIEDITSFSAFHRHVLHLNITSGFFTIPHQIV